MAVWRIVSPMHGPSITNILATNNHSNPQWILLKRPAIKNFNAGNTISKV